MNKLGTAKLVVVRLRVGALANVVSESLEMAFEVLTLDSDLAGSRLEIIHEPVCLCCGGCGKEFSPPPIPTALFAECPLCKEEIGHKVLSGTALYIENIEVE